MEKLCKRLANGEKWLTIFPGVASINITGENDGLTLCLRLTKNQGTPVRLLKEGESTNAVVAVRRVNELDFYSLSPATLAKKVDLTQPKCRAVVDHLGLRKDMDCFKEIKIGAMKHARYSPHALDKIKAVLRSKSIDEIWAYYRESKKEQHNETICHASSQEPGFQIT